MSTNPIISTDSYKISQNVMYDDNVNSKLVGMYASIVPRKNGEYEHIVVAGIAYLKHVLSNIKVTSEHINEAVLFYKGHFGSDVFDRTPWDIIVNKYEGNLPLKICALPEGTIVSAGTPIVTIENTDDECAHIVSHFEGIFQKIIWYMTTVATVSLSFSTVMKNALKASTDDWESPLKFMHHDFGYRGASSEEASIMSGMAHLFVSFGSDTVSAVKWIMDNIPERDESRNVLMAGFSVPASEHNQMMSRGEDGEFGLVKNILNKFPTGIVSVVADTFNMERHVETITTGEFFETIIRRDGKYVIRPDSQFVGTTKLETVLKILEIMETNMTHLITTNSKGYKCLPPQYGIIYGDGLNKNDIYDILSGIISKGWAATNIAFGTGGNLVQKNIDRDTLRFAMKSSEQTYLITDDKGNINREIRNVSKKTPGKESQEGRFEVTRINGKIQTNSLGSTGQENLLQPIFINGNILGSDGIKDIRARIYSDRLFLDI